jgi:hypothetical protein
LRKHKNWFLAFGQVPAHSQSHDVDLV